MALNCYDLRTHTRQQLELAARRLPPTSFELHMLIGRSDRELGRNSQLVLNTSRTANWNCSELQTIACRRTELN
jgi:hypothetical protein